MYRVLAEDNASRERRNQLRHPNYVKPELLATGPNQVGLGISPSCWDRRNGLTTTCTSFPTSTAVTLLAGCWRIERPRIWQRD